MEFEFEDYSDISFEINNNKLFFSTFTIYSILYFLAYTNLSFSEAITPINFINKGHYYSHQLVAYYMSTIYSFITSSCGVLFVCGLLSLENIRSVYYFSFGYLLADIIYIILVSKLTKSYKKYIIIILHHIVMMFIFFEYCFIEDDDTFLRNYFVSLILIANYTNLIININSEYNLNLGLSAGALQYSVDGHKLTLHDNDDLILVTQYKLVETLHPLLVQLFLGLQLLV